MIRQEQWQGTPIYTMQNEQLIVSLCPSLGNNLFRIYDHTANREVLRVPTSPAELETTPGQFGTPLMMPPNRIRHGAFKYQDRSYQMEINTPNGHHIHGFLRNHPWTVTETSDSDSVCSLTSVFNAAEFPDVQKQYPHPLVIEMTYILKGASLVQKVKVSNSGDSPAPFGFGLHTWFLLDQEPEKWTLQLPVAEIWELDEDLMPTGKRLPLGEYAGLHEGLNLQGSNLDTVFQIGNHPRVARLFKEGYEIRYSASVEYKQWVIFTRGEAHDVICLEPYTWVTNAPNIDQDPEITGLRAIEPGETLQMEVVLDIIHNA